jgi:MFS family permease
MNGVDESDVRSVLRSLEALLISTAVMFLGQGMIHTLLPIKLSSLGFTPQSISAVGASYFAGFAMGAWRLGGLIRRVGQIRAFAGFISLVILTTLVLPLVPNPWSWALFRFTHGACSAGIVTSIESWLNTAAPHRTRGRVLAVYMIVTYVSMGIGSFLLNLYEVAGMELFSIGAMLFAASVVPVALSDTSAPLFESGMRQSQRELLILSPLSTLGALGGGLAMGGFYALGPLFGERLGLETGRITLIMAATIIGGVFLQFPTGVLSDRFKRRTILIGVGFLASGISLLILWSGASEFPLLLSLLVLYGGLSTSIYPLCLAHAADHLDRSADTTSVSSGLLMTYGVGAALGPLVAAPLFDLADGRGLFLFTATVMLLIGGAGVWEAVRQLTPARQDQGLFVVLPRFTVQAFGLSPRNRVPRAHPEIAGGAAEDGGLSSNRS